MTVIQAIQVATYVCGGFFCLIAAFCIHVSNCFEETEKKCLLAIQITAAVLLIMDALAWGYRGYPGKTGYYMVRISNFVVFFTSNILLAFFHTYVCYSVLGNTKGIRKNKIRIRAGYIFCLIGDLLVVISQFTGLYYYFDSDNYYHRAAWHPISLLIGLVVICIDFSLLIQYRKRMKKRMFMLVMFYISLPTITAVILMFHYGLSLISTALMITSMAMFLVAIREQARYMRSQRQALEEKEIEIQRQEQELKRKEKSLAENRSKLLVTQIQPHFLINSLITIKALCKKDGKQAIEAIDNFIGYLRGSMEAIDVDYPIPFDKEIETVKNYLYLEHKRFGAKLQVRYELKSNKFALPPLTLQPLVENAVRHGVRKKLAGGCVTIASFEDPENYCVLIVDDGAGFDISSLDEKDTKHVGIRNVRDRLRLMCNGKISISSTPGVGTKVLVRIPK